MLKSRNKLYLFLGVACTAGYFWLYWILSHQQHSAFEVCLFKRFTHIPCPSCGTTRSVLFLFKGNFLEAFMINPLGYIVALLMLIIPFWMVWDLIRNRESLYVFYFKMEHLIKKPKYAIPLVTLLVINWIWNLSKGL